MADGKEKTQRRVYLLPNELVERIVKFQEEKGLPSEVEAVRRLLDEALKSRDSNDAIVSRLVDRIKSLRIPAEAARELLIGHPLLDSIAFEGERIRFKLKDGSEYRIHENGEAEVPQDYGSEWEPYQAPKAYVRAQTKQSRDLDDEIPF